MTEDEFRTFLVLSPLKGLIVSGLSFLFPGLLVRVPPLLGIRMMHDLQIEDLLLLVSLLIVSAFGFFKRFTWAWTAVSFVLIGAAYVAATALNQPS